MRVVVGRDDAAADVRRADVPGARDVVAALASLVRQVVQESVWGGKETNRKWSRVNSSHK